MNIVDLDSDLLGYVVIPTIKLYMWRRYLHYSPHLVPHSAIVDGAVHSPGHAVTSNPIKET